jgi:alcohol dehydrogenase
MASAQQPTPGAQPSRGGRGASKKPRGRLRHYGGLLSPDVAAGTPVLLERARAQRTRRLVAAGTDALHERLRPTRRRMRALVAHPGGRLRFSDAPAPPAPTSDGAVVHPVAASTCDIDCPIALGRLQFPLPLHLGHECVAQVLAVGERVRTVKPGDIVLVPFQISCGSCAACRAGRTGNCMNVPPASMYGMGLLAGHWGGAFADELAVPYADAMLVPVPPELDPVAVASVADNICDAYRHIAPHVPGLLAEDADADVLIIAATGRRFLFSSSLALYTGLIARALGARNVCVADSRPSLRAHAERLGLEAVDPRTLRRRPPSRLVVDASVDQLPLAIAKTAPDGICSSAGSFHRGARIPTLSMYIRNISLHVGRAHVRALIPQVLELIADGRVHPEEVITSVASLDDAPRALGEHFAGDGVKTVLSAS